MAKVKDILGGPPQFTIETWDSRRVDPAQIWARYDSESDHVIMYFNGRPQPAVSVYTDENVYVMVAPGSRQIVGLQVENWERSFVPAHKELQTVWPQLKQVLETDQPVNGLLQMLALWTISVLQNANGITTDLQPA